MKEIGKVVEIENNKVKVLIKRGTACGDCGGCQIGRDNLSMILEADNDIHAKVGDEVEIDLQTSNFLLATAIAYGIPLMGMIIGIVGSYYLLQWMGVQNDKIQGIAGIMGLIVLAASYLLIKFNEKKISRLNQFKPVLSSIVNKND